MFLGITPVSSVSNGLYFLILPLVSVMRVIYRKIRHARYLYIKRNVEKVWGARYISKNTVFSIAIVLNSAVYFMKSSRGQNFIHYYKYVLYSGVRNIVLFITV